MSDVSIIRSSKIKLKIIEININIFLWRLSWKWERWFV